jgi:putative membrane protein
LEDELMRLLAIGSLIALAAAAPSLAQPAPGNPAMMAPGTPQAAPGVPAAHEPNQNDRLFVYEATIGGRAEVEFGQLAEQKGPSQAVHDFGRQMVTDHGKANQQLTQLAQAANIPQPSALDEEHNAMRSRFQNLDGGDFDLAYIRGQVTDHQKTAQLFEWEIGVGQDPQLKAFASEILPVIFRHLQMAQSIEKQLSAVATAANPPGDGPAASGRPPAR